MDYPTVFPLEEAKHVISAIRAGTVGTELASLANDVWTIQGYAMSMLIGNPVSQAVAGTEDPVAALEKVVASHESGATAQAVIDWAQVAQWATNLLIQWMLTRK